MGSKQLAATEVYSEQLEANTLQKSIWLNRKTSCFNQEW